MGLSLSYHAYLPGPPCTVCKKGALFYWHFGRPEPGKVTKPQAWQNITTSTSREKWDW